MIEPLEDLIKGQINDLSEEKLSTRVTKYENYKNKFTVLKPRVTVTIELTSGKVAEMDITDYFEGVIK